MAMVPYVPPPPKFQITSFLFADSRRDAMKTEHMAYVMSERFVHKLPNHGLQSGFSMEWGNFITEGQPAYCVNPKIGTVLIWAEKKMTLSDIGFEQIFLLVTPVRPSMAPKDTYSEKAVKLPLPGMPPKEVLVAHGAFGMRVPSGTPGRKPVKVVPGDYYEIPANIMLPEGTTINYVVTLNCLILDIIIPDSSGEGVVLVEVKAAEGITTMTMKEFNDIMTADPPQKSTFDFMRAYSAFHMTNPTIVAKFLPSAKRTFSAGAKPYLINTNTEFAAITARYEDRPKAHLYHP